MFILLFSDSDHHEKTERADEKQKPSKANPKEIVFLDEEGDLPSKESGSDDDEIAIPEGSHHSNQTPRKRLLLQRMTLSFQEMRLI